MKFKCRDNIKEKVARHDLNSCFKARIIMTRSFFLRNFVQALPVLSNTANRKENLFPVDKNDKIRTRAKELKE